MLQELKTKITEYLNEEIKKNFDIESNVVVEVPKDKTNGDFAIPSFSLCKVLHKSPVEIAPILKGYLEKLPYFENVVIVGPYVNCFFSRSKLSELIINDLETLEQLRSKVDKAIEELCEKVKNRGFLSCESSYIQENIREIFKRHLGE